MTSLTTLDTYVARRNFFNFLGLTCRLLDSAGQMLYYVKLKAFKLKEDITIFTDETKKEAVLNIKARAILDFSAAYDVIDSKSGQVIGALKRKGLKSAFFRDEWEIWNTQDQPIGKVQEDSAWLAIMRRIFGGLNFFPQNYTIFLGERPVGKFRGTWNPFIVKYTTDLSGDPDRQLDRRLVAAASIMLMCVEGKQG